MIHYQNQIFGQMYCGWCGGGGGVTQYSDCINVV